MNQLNWLLLLMLLSPLVLSAQDDTLFTYGDDGVPLEEFVYVYEKNNSQDSTIYEQSSIDEYLDLYINFKLKVKEAEAQGYDTIQSIQKELGTYRKQLARSYLTDRNITDKLVDEAYERMKYEVKTAHILVKFVPTEDTTQAYNKAMEVRKMIEKGANFSDMAKQFSGDPSVKDNNGDLGYITVFQTVYPFENAVYSTAVGEVSQPVRTQFGYHLVKVDDKRLARGKVKVAHLLVKVPKGTKDSKPYIMRADSLYSLLEAGSSFEELVKANSDDKTTSAKGGELPWFTTGKMVAEFEEAAFELEKVGDYSKPIQTRFGYHLIKLLDKKPIGTAKEMSGELKRKLKKDERSSVSKDVFVKKLKSEYKYKGNASAYASLNKMVDATVLKGKWRAPDASKLKATLFEMGGNKYSQADFATYLERFKMGRVKEKDELVEVAYDSYVEKKVLEIEESRLDEKYPDFRRLMQEYRDGILLFELTDKMVWSKALSDTLGLEAFYQKNSSNHMWDKRLDAKVYECANAKLAKKVQKSLSKGVSVEEIVTSYTVDGKENVSVSEGLFERGQNEYIDKIKWEKGVSKNYTDKDGKEVFVVVNEVVEPAPKKLTEARGYFVSDYQKQLEDEWIETLRKKYPVSINRETLKKLYGRSK